MEKQEAITAVNSWEGKEGKHYRLQHWDESEQVRFLVMSSRQMKA